jgi:ankyrin repeat protein
MLRTEEGNIEEIHRILTEHPGFDINAQNRNGSTALALATKNGAYDIVSVLIQAGADVNLPNNVLCL